MWRLLCTAGSWKVSLPQWHGLYVHGSMESAQLQGLDLIISVQVLSIKLLYVAINQFTKTLDKNQAESLFKLLLKYRPETKTEKRERLLAEAEARTGGKVIPQPSISLNL